MFIHGYLLLDKRCVQKGHVYLSDLSSLAPQTLWAEIWPYVYLKPTGRISNPTLSYKTQRIRSRDSDSYLHTNGCSNIIHSIQEVKMTQISIDGWMDKQSVVYAHNGMLCSLKKEGNPAVCYNVCESWSYYVNWKCQSQNSKNRMIPLIWVF